MMIYAYLLAFPNGGPMVIRPIEIPDAKMASQTDDTERLMDLAFQYGQNDFQLRECRSVSVGDVIEIHGSYEDESPAEFWLIEPVGFSKTDRPPCPNGVQTKLLGDDNRCPLCGTGDYNHPNIAECEMCEWAEEEAIREAELHAGWDPNP